MLNSTAKQFSVRYGQNYKVVLAICLPCILLVPFIFLMQHFSALKEWQVWLMIYGFLGLLISFSLWLVKRIYPAAELTITRNEVSLHFNKINIFSPKDFSFKIADIVSLTQHEMGGDEFFRFKTQNPSRKFQLSASTQALENQYLLQNSMEEIIEYLNNQQEPE